MRISSIAAKDNSIVLKMERADPVPQMTWIGEEAVLFSLE